MRKPNIIYLLADDWGYGDVSCLNPDSKIPTPHTDKLASEGMIFTDAHSNSAVCTPTRYGVLTGRYAWRSRMKRGVLNGYYDILPYLKGEQEETIREGTVHHSISGEFAIRRDQWKLVECRGSGGWRLREADVPEDAPPMQLYDMANDPEEQNNLYTENPEIVAALQALLNGYREGDRSAKG